jgi:glycosyltransferase involved in cell wall biosynthesis
MIAIRIIELTKPLELPPNLEGKDGVRFYCTLRGDFIGHFTVWSKGRPIGRSQFLQEFTRNMGQTLLERLYGERFDGKVEPWSNLQHLLRAQFGLEPAELDFGLPAEEPLKLPKLTASITIPTRDRPDDIRRCLESLTNHKSQILFEIIVADNNPASGKTEPVVRSFPGVTYLPEPRPGVTFARNAAALHAQGDIIVCTDDDVTYVDGWLDNLIAPYADPEVMAVTGMVMPFELDYEAQHWFEVYGSLTRNFKRTRYDRGFYENTGFMPMVPTWDIGVTANASFRAEVFADPKIGPFDDELRIAEDPYILYRMVKNNRVIIYEPRAVVQHRHRQTMEGLARQLYNYGRSSTGMELRTFFVDGDRRGLNCLWDIAKFDRDRILQIRKGERNFPMELVVAETKGHLMGPFSLLKSIWQVRTKYGRYTAEQFALAQAARQRAKLEQQRQLAEAAEIKQLTEPGQERQIGEIETEGVVVN